jgi:hypothetical protein
MDEPKDKVEDFWQEHALVFLEMAFRTDRQNALCTPPASAIM